MKILVLSRNYRPELTGIGPYTTDFCEYLAQHGEDVTVITSFPYYPHWSVPGKYRKKWMLGERTNGVNVLRTYMRVRRGRLQQIYHEFSFCFSALLAIFQIDRDYDVIVCVSPPLTLGVIAHFFSKIMRIPFVFHIQDLLPDTAVNLGLLREGKIVQVFRHLERRIYEKAAAIGVISPGFKKNLCNKGVPESEINYLPNWIDLDMIQPLERDNVFRKDNEISKDTFVVLYSGNIGNKQGLEILLDTASILEQHTDIVFFIVGEGSCKSGLLNKAQEMGISNVRFLTLQPKEMLPYMLSAADALVITQQANVVDIVLPSKLLSYMASGNPVVASVNSNSETAVLIKAAQSGLVVEPGNAEVLAQAIIHLRNSENLRRNLGNNGRSYVSEHFEKSVILKKFRELLYRVARQVIHVGN